MFRYLKYFIILLMLVSSVVPAFASYVLCLGVYQKSEAESLHQELASRGYPVYLLYGENFEVRLGSFETREKAEEVASKLQSEEKLVASVKEEENLDQYQATWEADNPGKEVDTQTFHAYKDPQAQKIVSLALDLFGHPYKYGGTCVGKGIDCSYFCQLIFKELGLNLPRTSGEQFKTGAVITDSKQLKVGDLVFFQKTYYSKRKKGSSKKGVTRINHVGIYIGNGEFIHATINVKRVTISRLDEAYFTKRFAGARRILN
jgi:cell wall-associated NlpC family hydrolase